jgi:hypothetical protein
VGAIDESLSEIDLAATPEVFGDGTKDFVEHAFVDPLLKASMTGLIRRVTTRHVRPWGTRSQHP